MRGRPFSLGAALSRCLARIWPILGTSLLVSLIAGVGTLLLIVPGFIALLMLYVAVPACVVEGLGPAASLGRSAELTKGFRWKILGLILLVSLISIICSLLVTFILTLFTGAFVAALGKFAVQALTTALSGVLAAVIYYSLRAAKEESISIKSSASSIEAAPYCLMNLLRRRDENLTLLARAPAPLTRVIPRGCPYRRGNGRITGHARARHAGRCKTSPGTVARPPVPPDSSNRSCDRSSPSHH